MPQGGTAQRIPPAATSRSDDIDDYTHPQLHETPIGFKSLGELLRSAHGPNLLRVKGIVKIAENPDQPVVIHGVQHVFHPPAQLAVWPDSDHRTRMVFIVRDIAPTMISGLFDAFLGKPRVDTPDRTALLDNPLATHR